MPEARILRILSTAWAPILPDRSGGMSSLKKSVASAVAAASKANRTARIQSWRLNCTIVQCHFEIMLGSAKKVTEPKYNRSEERRVGKESRALTDTCRYKKARE